MTIPSALLAAAAGVHPSWRAAVLQGLQAVDAVEPAYLPALAASDYLPTEGRIFAAFSEPLSSVRHVLVGEGPYPRAASATGFCFMDGAVDSLWSPDPDGGLAKPVNKATSLRNFLKMLLVADGRLAPGQTGGSALAAIARELRAGGTTLIATLADLQRNLTAHGFLLLNASLVFRADVAPVIDARAWQPFMLAILDALAARPSSPPILVLWGKIAEQINRLPQAAHFPQAVSEHPYNLSFIVHPGMQALFGPLHLLQRGRPTDCGKI